MKTIYSPEQAAKFLRVSEKELAAMTERGELRLWKDGRCGKLRLKHYYLGGQLDAARGLMSVSIPYTTGSGGLPGAILEG